MLPFILHFAYTTSTSQKVAINAFHLKLMSNADAD